MECRKERGKPVLPWTHIGHAREVELVSTMRSPPNLCRRGQRRPGQETESFIWSTASLRSAGTGNVKFVREECREWISGFDLSHIIRIQHRAWTLIPLAFNRLLMNLGELMRLERLFVRQPVWVTVIVIGALEMWRLFDSFCFKKFFTSFRLPNVGIGWYGFRCQVSAG